MSEQASDPTGPLEGAAAQEALKAVSDTVILLSRCETVDEMCRLAGDKTFRANPESYVIVSLYDPVLGATTITHYFGFEGLDERGVALLGSDPRLMGFSPAAITEEERSLYTSGRLEEIPGGIHALLTRQVPEKLCRQVEELLGVEKVLSVGWALGPMPRGGIIILQKTGCPVRGRFLIEIMAGQVSLAIRHRQAEQEKKDLGAQLRHAQKMEALGTLAGGIAHDFNNILSAIIGYSELARMETGKGSFLRGNLEKVLLAAKRDRELVRQVLTFSRRTQEELIEVQVHDVVSEALRLLRPSLPAFIRIRDHVPVCRPVKGDPTQIHQVVMNLCTNAFHAMAQKGGTLEVALDDIDLGPEEPWLTAGLSPGPYVRLVVVDTGCGMGPDVLERIFDPYFTTRSKGEGSGLGLSVVHGIVKNHGGHIRFDSRPGHGTRAEVLLPALSRPMDRAMPAALLSVPRGTERVLFVDDETALVEIATQMLKTLGYRVTGVSSPQEALEIFLGDPEAFDVVVTDLAMPDLPGDRLAKRMLAVRPTLPMILCTGYSECMTEERAMDIGLSAFVHKPLDLYEMGALLRRVLD